VRRETAVAWTTETLWRAYETLDRSRVHASKERVLTNLVSLVKFAIGKEGQFESFPEPVRQRFENWIAEQQANGSNFNDDQIQWLTAIAGWIAVRSRPSWLVSGGKVHRPIPRCEYRRWAPRGPPGAPPNPKPVVRAWRRGCQPGVVGSTGLADIRKMLPPPGTHFRGRRLSGGIRSFLQGLRVPLAPPLPFERNATTCISGRPRAILKRPIIQCAVCPLRFV